MQEQELLDLLKDMSLDEKINQMVQLQSVHPVAYYSMQVYRHIINSVFFLIGFHALLCYNRQKTTAQLVDRTSVIRIRICQTYRKISFPIKIFFLPVGLVRNHIHLLYVLK